MLARMWRKGYTQILLVVGKYIATATVKRVQRFLKKTKKNYHVSFCRRKDTPVDKWESIIHYFVFLQIMRSG